MSLQRTAKMKMGPKIKKTQRAQTMMKGPTMRKATTTSHHNHWRPKIMQSNK